MSGSYILRTISEDFNKSAEQRKIQDIRDLSIWRLYIKVVPLYALSFLKRKKDYILLYTNVKIVTFKYN